MDSIIVWSIIAYIMDIQYIDMIEESLKTFYEKVSSKKSYRVPQVPSIV